MRNASRIETKSPTQTKRAAAKILRAFFKKPPQPLVFALAGELGSGKTTFIQGLARALGIREKVLSPTFVLMKVFQLRGKPFRNFVHLDAYRVENPKEFISLGIRELIRDPANLVVIEWADRIKAHIPRGAVWVRFKHGKKSHERRLQISKF